MHAQSVQQSQKVQRKEQIEAQRSAYVTTRIGLTNETAQAFWPVYNRYRVELDANRKSAVQMGSKKFIVDTKTDAELKDAMESRFKNEEERLKIQRKYHIEFSKILTIHQLAKFYQAEEEFKKEILKEIKRR